MEVRQFRNVVINVKAKKNNLVSFKATPDQITQALSTTPVCKGKSIFLSHIAGFFKEVESQLTSPDSFVYKLGKKNEIPKEFQDINVNGVTIKELDKRLNEDSFQCNSQSSCSCGKGLSKGQLASNLLKFLKLEEPTTITIKKDRF